MKQQGFRDVEGSGQRQSKRVRQVTTVPPVHVPVRRFAALLRLAPLVSTSSTCLMFSSQQQQLRVACREMGDGREYIDRRDLESKY